MNCDGVVRSVSSYIDGEVEVSVQREIEVHLAGCQECAILVQQTKYTVTWYRDSDLVDYPGDVRSRLHERLKRQMRGKQG